MLRDGKKDIWISIMSTLQIERRIRGANFTVNNLPADHTTMGDEIDLMTDTAVIDIAVTVGVKALHQVVMDLRHAEGITLLLAAVEADHHHAVDPLLEIEVLLEGIPLLHHHHQGTTEEDTVVAVLPQPLH